MKLRPRFSLRAFIIAAMLLSHSQYFVAARASVLTFDDLPGESQIPNGYGGFNWGNVWYEKPSTPFSGLHNGVVSGTDIAYNAGGDPAYISGPLFNFEGAYLTGAWSDGLNVTVKGILGGQEIYSETVVINTDAPTWFDFEYSGITNLEFISFGGTHHDGYPGEGTVFAIDNYTTTIVPEPSAFCLLAIATIFCGGFIFPIR
jgi:hypothetical protein